MENGVSLYELMDTLGADSFAPTKRNSARGSGNTDPRRAYRLHVSDRLLDQHDGPMLEALKRLNDGTLQLPARPRDHPDQDRLAMRFERFKAAA